MEHESEQKNTGRGLQKLMNRYRKRAEGILYGSEFNDNIESLRSAWNKHYPTYAIDPRDNTAQPFYPRMPPRLWSDLQSDWEYGRSQLTPPPARFAFVGWIRTVSSLEHCYWPPEDFHPPLRYGGAVSAEFVAGCVLYGPKALPEDLPAYFPQKTGVLWLTLMESLQRDGTASLPFHPDMNAHDMLIAKKFLDPFRQEKSNKTTSARIDQLRHEGASDNEIAKRLGLPRTTVSDHPSRG